MMNLLIDIEKFIELLPSGSGINCSWEYKEFLNGKIEFKNYFHAMTEHGYYDGYMPFKFTVDFVDGAFTFNRIICNENRRASFYGLKEYLVDTIDYALSQITLEQVFNDDLYLSWVNEFITIKSFAEYHDLTNAQALLFIETGRSIYKKREESKVFAFDQLPDDLKEKAIDKLRDINVQFDWYDLDYYKEKLSEIGFINAEIQFSGFYSQGDGASFTADIDMEKLINSLIYCNRSNINPHTLMSLERLHYHGEINLDYAIARTSSKYSHEMTCYVRNMAVYDINGKFSNQACSFFHFLFKDIEQEIIQYRLELCQWIYSSLEKEYEYLTSDNAIIETIKCNEYQFNEKGEII